MRALGFYVAELAVGLDFGKAVAAPDQGFWEGLEGPSETVNLVPQVGLDWI